MRKEIIAVIILILLAFTQKNIDIEDRNYALVVGMDESQKDNFKITYSFAVSYQHLRAHDTKANLVCRLLLEKKKSCCYDFTSIHVNNIFS